jgi:hypothetical protein
MQRKKNRNLIDGDEIFEIRTQPKQQNTIYPPPLTPSSSPSSPSTRNNPLRTSQERYNNPLRQSQNKSSPSSLLPPTTPRNRRPSFDAEEDEKIARMIAEQDEKRNLNDSKRKMSNNKGTIINPSINQIPQPNLQFNPTQNPWEGENFAPQTQGQQNPFVGQGQSSLSDEARWVFLEEQTRKEREKLSAGDLLSVSSTASPLPSTRYTLPNLHAVETSSLVLQNQSQLATIPQPQTQPKTEGGSEGFALNSAKGEQAVMEYARKITEQQKASPMFMETEELIRRRPWVERLLKLTNIKLNKQLSTPYLEELLIDEVIRLGYTGSPNFHEIELFLKNSPLKFNL